MIPPSEYGKYAEKTEELQKELKEIESPERRARVKVYSDVDADLLDNEDHNIFYTRVTGSGNHCTQTKS